jgi:hypothetical protein
MDDLDGKISTKLQPSFYDWVEVLKYVENKRELSVISKSAYDAVQSSEGHKTLASINCFDIVSFGHKLCY